MAIHLLALHLLYGVAGAREHFEHLCADLIRAEFSGAKEVRCQSGDGGVDVYIGDWADPEGISVFQVKYFPVGLGSSQKDQVHLVQDRRSGSIHSNVKTSEHHHRTPRKEQLLPSLWKYQTGWANKLLLAHRPYKMGVSEQER